jgi:hypothetical protein
MVTVQPNPVPAEQPAPLRQFLDTVRNWLAAIDRRDEPTARFYADELDTAAGKMLVIDPEFRRMYKKRLNGCSAQTPEEVLRCMSIYLHAATDAGLSGKFRSASM